MRSRLSTLYSLSLSLSLLTPRWFDKCASVRLALLCCWFFLVTLAVAFFPLGLSLSRPRKSIGALRSICFAPPRRLVALARSRLRVVCRRRLFCWRFIIYFSTKTWRVETNTTEAPANENERRRRVGLSEKQCCLPLAVPKRNAPCYCHLVAGSPQQLR